MAKLEHLICPKVGGGLKPTCAPPPTFESAGAQAPAAPLLLRPCHVNIYIIQYVENKKIPFLKRIKLY